MNTGRPKGNQKHLDLSARIIIEQHLNNGDSFRSIAIELSKDPSTISKEIRRHSHIGTERLKLFFQIRIHANIDIRIRHNSIPFHYYYIHCTFFYLQCQRVFLSVLFKVSLCYVEILGVKSL